MERFWPRETSPGLMAPRLRLANQCSAGVFLKRQSKFGDSAAILNPLSAKGCRILVPVGESKALDTMSRRERLGES